MKLKEMEIEIEGEKFKIRELDTDSALKLTQFADKDREQIARKMLEFSLIEPKATEELFKSLPAKAGLKLIAEINKLNGFETLGFTTVPEVLPKPKSGN